MVRIQPPLGRADCAYRGAVGAAQPPSYDAMGSLLAAELCWFSRLHPVARRSRELASWPTSFLAELRSARRAATSFRGPFDCAFRSLRMRRTSRQVEGALGYLRFSCNVRSRCRDAA